MRDYVTITKGRDITIDIIRGIAIILVVLGHTSIYNAELQWFLTLKNIIYSFHMPLFFAISGFVFGRYELEEKRTALIKKKLVGLGIPYIIFSIVYIFFNVLLQQFVSTSTHVKILDIYKIFYIPVAHYWFVFILIIYFVVFTCCFKMMKTYMYYAVALLSIFLYVCLYKFIGGTIYDNGLFHFPFLFWQYWPVKIV